MLVDRLHDRFLHVRLSSFRNSGVTVAPLSSPGRPEMCHSWWENLCALQRESTEQAVRDGKSRVS